MKSSKKEGKNRKSKGNVKQQPSLSSSSSSSSSKPSSFPTHLLSFSKNKNGRKNGYNNDNYKSYNNGANASSSDFSSTGGKLLTVVPNAVFVSRNFLSQNECDAWIQFAEDNVGFEKLSSPQTREYAHRQCGRIQINDWTMAELLYQRMEILVEEIANQVTVSSFFGCDNYRPVCCNGNLRLYKYEKNMSFGRHYDGSNRIDRFPGGNTEITVLIYLSSCEGGATRFHLPHQQQKKGTSGKPKNSKKQKVATQPKVAGSAADADADTEIQNIEFENDGNGIAFVPEAGAILMHMHGDRCLEHEADPVLRGVKYILRTDIVYSNKNV
mmetsp:Transcript_26299/g.39432  ORF Transcript_26299/g.39432 Transcript_26299/m.39432 type:complete len:326 (+) Transcript_26299:65-1042(+)